MIDSTLSKLRLRKMLKMRRYHLLILILIIAGVLLLIKLTDEEQWWNKWLDPAIGFGTFLFAAAVWYSEWRYEWEEKLPKRLTVRFMHAGKLVMICKQAHLTGEADIRPWGQQIGSQMCQNRDLNLLPFFETASGGPKIGVGKEIFKPYYLSIFLSDLPTDLKEKVQAKEEDESQYLRWVQGEKGQYTTSWERHPAVLPPLDQNDAL